MQRVTAVFVEESSSLVKVGIDLIKAKPDDKISVYVDSEKVGEITDAQEDGFIEVSPGTEVDLRPESSDGSYFSYFTQVNPPFKVYDDILVEAHFRVG